MGCINSFDTAHDYLSESLFKLCFQSPDRVISDKLASAEYPLKAESVARILFKQLRIVPDGFGQIFSYCCLRRPAP